MKIRTTALVSALCATTLPLLLAPIVASGSSHREAPNITRLPTVDSTDFYLFNSYEAGRAGYVTLIANYLPLQDPYGGPNYFALDPDALYEIHVDNDGDAVEDITFQFRFENRIENHELTIGTGTTARTNAVALYNLGRITAQMNDLLNVRESYTLTVVRDGRRSGNEARVANPQGGDMFTKPADYVGTNSFADYDAYARSFIYENVQLPGCAATGA